MEFDINFDNIDYLKEGNSRQQQAYNVLMHHDILQKLKPFDPILVGTIPINIDIETSDLDIICYFTDKQEFQRSITDQFNDEQRFAIREQPSLDVLAIVANFFLDDFEIEIFGQNIPTKQQVAYRHLVVEHDLHRKYGEKFRQQIIELKKQGQKTEPAFGLALGLTGDPYAELLKFETNDKSPNR